MTEAYKIETLDGSDIEIAPPSGRWVVINAGAVWALRIDKDGITSNPDLPTDEGAKAIIAALNHLGFPQSLIADEREACAQIAETAPVYGNKHIAAAIRARGSK